MKRFNDIFEKIIDIENLKFAHLNARKDKTFYKEVKMVDANPDYYLSMIRDMLTTDSYLVSDYDVSVINDKGKARELMKLPYFPDRIIQWAIMLQIEPIFLQVFTNHTCASIPGRGIHKAAHYMEKYMKDREGCKYCLKIDISKFYPNINHKILKKLLRKKIKDERLLSLLDRIIDSYPGNKGVPIGSYLSQYFANFYLSYFDHWLKEEKKVKYVVRYMDDIVIFGSNKESLHKLLSEMKQYLQDNLDLQVKPNHQVFPTDVRGVDFVGYRFFFDFKLLRKKTCKRFKEKMFAIKKKQDNGNLMNYSEWCSMNSYVGWLTWCDSFRLWKKYIEPIIPSAMRYYRYVVLRRTNPENRSGKYSHYKSTLLKGWYAA